MTERADLRCRVAACLEGLGDGKEWSFYLINDGSRPLSRVVLKTFGKANLPLVEPVRKPGWVVPCEARD